MEFFYREEERRARRRYRLVLLALLAAYVQERSWPESAANRVMIQPAPFASAVQIN